VGGGEEGGVSGLCWVWWLGWEGWRDKEVCYLEFGLGVRVVGEWGRGHLFRCWGW
jgi:hypothetical protein